MCLHSTFMFINLVNLEKHENSNFLNVCEWIILTHPTMQLKIQLTVERCNQEILHEQRRFYKKNIDVALCICTNTMQLHVAFNFV